MCVVTMQANENQRDAMWRGARLKTAKRNAELSVVRRLPPPTAAHGMFLVHSTAGIGPQQAMVVAERLYIQVRDGCV